MVVEHRLMESQCCSENVFSGGSISLTVKLSMSQYTNTWISGFLSIVKTALEHLVSAGHSSRPSGKYIAV